MEVLEPTNEPREKTIQEQSVEKLTDVLLQVRAAFEGDPNARFYAKPGFIGRSPGVLDCEIITLQIFLPKNPAGAGMAEHIIREQMGQPTAAPRIVVASAVGRG